MMRLYLGRYFGGSENLLSASLRSVFKREKVRCLVYLRAEISRETDSNTPTTVRISVFWVSENLDLLRSMTP